MNTVFENDIPKYKKASRHKTPTKAKHKHMAKPCVLSYPQDWWQKEHLRNQKREYTIDYYCPICGKIMGLKEQERWYTSKVLKGFSICSVETEECKKELNDETRTIPLFEISNPFDKFVDL